MRIGKGNSIVDNGHAGGIFIAIDDDGVLHEKAVSLDLKEYYSHPDTGFIFKGYKIDGLDKVISAAKKCAVALSQVGMISFDFTIDEKGDPCLIEANCAGGSAWLIQGAHGVGAFGDNTEKILDWVCQNKNHKKYQREKYYFGNMG